MSGTAQTPYRPAGLVLDTEGLDFSGPPVACPLYANRALALSEEQCGGGPPGKQPPKPPKKPTPFPCNKYSKLGGCSAAPAICAQHLKGYLPTALDDCPCTNPKCGPAMPCPPGGCKFHITITVTRTLVGKIKISIPITCTITCTQGQVQQCTC